MNERLPENIKNIFSTTPAGGTVFIAENHLTGLIRRYASLPLNVNRNIDYTESLPETKSFYFLPQDLTKVEQSGKNVDSIRSKTVNILNKYVNETVIISLKDEGSRGLSESSKAHFRELGINIDELKMRGAFAAIINNGKLVSYNIDNNAPVFLAKDKLQSLGIDEVSSAGFVGGNFSEIVIDGKNRSKQERGLNFVVRQKSGEIISLNVDTYLTDLDTDHIYQAK
jgi:hypothetical protein